MAVLDRGISALSQALLEQGFHAVDEFDVFVTFARDNDPLRIHAGPDGAFAVFDSDDELITDGEGGRRSIPDLGHENGADQPTEATASTR
jgi:hypothetical protein